MASTMAKVVPFPKPKLNKKKNRKSGLNKNKFGSVTNCNGKVWIDFMYLGERARESCQVPYNKENIKEARIILDKIDIAIKKGEFRYSKTFPLSSKKDKFCELEIKNLKLKPTPEQIYCKEYFDSWYEVLRNTGSVTERTLYGYKSLLNLYLRPFFSDYTFANLNSVIFKNFISFAKNTKYRNKVIGNKTINKSFTVLKMICKSVAIEYDWITYNPFFGYKKLPEKDSYENIDPFSIEEQNKIIEELPEFWKPYFYFAFASGMRPGEQIAIKSENIDWKKKILHIKQAMTRDENGKSIEGSTKNKYSKRDINLTEGMLDALQKQKKIYDQFEGKYFFCNSNGSQVHCTNLRSRVWRPTLEKIGLRYRAMKQTDILLQLLP